MHSVYKVLLAELPRIAEVLQAFPDAQRDKAFDILVDALKASHGFASQAGEVPVAEVKTILKNKIQEAAVEPNKNQVETEASKKLSKLRAKIFEKTTAVTVDDTENDPVIAGLDELSTQDLSNIVFYQKGRKTPLSDML
jgi:hypothetical protein